MTKQMESFIWGDHFVTGLEEVDRQHHHLVDVINQFGGLLTESDRIAFNKVEGVFSDLAAYAQYHFAEEENLMKSMALDARHTVHHFREHDNFLQEVTQMHAAISPNHLEKAESLLKFLIYWLAYHILGSDQSMAKQVKVIRGGLTPEEAYLAEEKKKEGAVEPLLHALNGLFHQVSERNQELRQLNQTLEARVEERTRELAEANQQLEAMAMTDMLTSLPNRRHGMRYFSQLWDASTQSKKPLACMMIDADGFKQINDTCGHDAGDEVLRQLSRNMRYEMRNDDVLCRLGGDEFLVICPDTPQDGAEKLAQKLRQAVAAMRVQAGTGVWKGSISIGVAGRTAGMADFEALIRAADEAVYVAKKNGRNRVEVAA